MSKKIKCPSCGKVTRFPNGKGFSYQCCPDCQEGEYQEVLDELKKLRDKLDEIISNYEH